MFSLRMHCCKPLIQLTGQVQYFRLSHENSFHTDIWCHTCFKMFSISLYHIQQMISSWRQFSLSSSLQIISRFFGNVKVMCFWLSTVSRLLIFGSFESIVTAHCAQQSQMFQNKSQYQYMHLKLRMLEIAVSGLLPHMPNR